MTGNDKDEPTTQETAEMVELGKLVAPDREKRDRPRSDEDEDETNEARRR
jgi:hypothetical protein